MREGEFLRLFENDILVSPFQYAGSRADFSRFRNPERYRTAPIDAIYEDLSNTKRIYAYYREHYNEQLGAHLTSRKKEREVIKMIAERTQGATTLEWN